MEFKMMMIILHNSSNTSLNIQVDTCTSGNTSDIPGPHSIMPVKCLYVLSTPSCSVIHGETLLSPSTISSLDFGIRASPVGFTGAVDKLITSASFTVAVDKPITSRNKTDFLPRQNHQNLIPLKQRQSQQFRLCKKSVIFGNVNARSLRNKAEVLVDHVIDKKIDVCDVTETRLPDEDTVALVAL